MITNLVATITFAVVTNWSAYSCITNHITNDDGVVLEYRYVTQIGVVRSNTTASFVYKGEVIQVEVESKASPIHTQWRNVEEFKLLSIP